MMNSPQGALKAINLTCMRYTYGIKPISEQAQKRVQAHFREEEDKKCRSAIRFWQLRGDMVDEFSIILFFSEKFAFFKRMRIHLWLKSMTHGHLNGVFARCICVQIQFNLELCCYMVSNVCACLHRLNRKYRLLRSIAVIEAKQYDIVFSLSLSLCLCVCVCFCFASGESWFFCGDLTVSYTLLLFTSRYKISRVSRIFLSTSFILSYFFSVTVGKYEYQASLQSNADLNGKHTDKTHFHLLSIFPFVSIFFRWYVSWMSCVNFIAKRVGYHRMPLFLLALSSHSPNSCFVIVKWTDRIEWYVHLHQKQFEYVVCLNIQNIEPAEEEKICLEFGFVPFVSSRMGKKSIGDKKQQKKVMLCSKWLGRPRNRCFTSFGPHFFRLSVRNVCSFAHSHHTQMKTTNQSKDEKFHG